MALRATQAYFRELLDDFMKIQIPTGHGVESLSLPVIPVTHLYRLCTEMQLLFRSEPIMMNLSSPITIIGDLHGHLFDLLRILKQHGLPVETKYLFLGDLVDRGEYSIETVTLIFTLKLLWPEKVFIIRGNHEFEFLCLQCGFSKQLVDVYPNDPPLGAFLEAFAQMPLAATINEKILCVHGGIGPGVFSLQQIYSLIRPIRDFGNDVLDSLLWSDPSNHVDMYEPSNRGTGFFFGEEALDEFLTNNSLEMMIRAHECVPEGVELMFGGKLVTVFSASYYCGLTKNKAAVIVVDSESNLQSHTYLPLPYFRRSQTNFVSKGAPPVKASSPMRKRISASVSTSTLPSLAMLSEVPSEIRKSPPQPRPRKTIAPSSSFVIRPKQDLLRFK